MLYPAAVLLGARHRWRSKPAWLLACVSIMAAQTAGCGGSASSDGTDGSGWTAATTAPQRTSGPTRAALEPVDGNSATGTARFLIPPKSTPLLQIEAHGLEPASGESRYAIWIVGDRHDMVSLAAFQVGADGRLLRKIGNVESHAFVEDGTKTELLVTRVENVDQLNKSIAESTDPWDPPQIGEPVLHGSFEGALVGSAAAGE